MIFIFGIIGFMQIAFIPGYLALSAMKIDGFIRKLVLGFAISLVCNYLFVLILVGLNIYLRVLVIPLVVLECLVILWILRDKFRYSLADLFQLDQWKQFTADYSSTINKPTADKPGTHLQYWLSMAAPILASAAIIRFVTAFASSFGEIFTAYDPVNAWNRWGMEWARNMFPTQIWHYPQLISANWSVIYVLQGTSDVRIFTKGSAWLFEVAILLVLFEMGVRYRRRDFFIAVPVTEFLLWKLGWLGIGNVDSAVAFFGLAAFACLIYAHKSTSLHQHNLFFFLGAVMAAAASITKQAGLFMILAYIPLYITLVRRNSPFSSLSGRTILGSLLMLLVLTGFWYAYAQSQIQTGQEANEAAYITSGIYTGQGFFERLLSAIRDLVDILRFSHWRVWTFRITSVILSLSLLILSLRHPEGRWVTMLLVVPYTLIWLIGFSYDFRNLNFVLPFIGIAFGLTFWSLLDWLDKLPIDRVRVWHVLFVAIILAVGLAFRFDDNDMLNRAEIQQMQMGIPSLNNRLYAYAANHEITGIIYSDYPILWDLPIFEDHYRQRFMLDPWFSAQPEFIEAVQASDVHYVLYNAWRADPAVDTYFHQKLADKEYELIFEYEGWYFIDLLKEKHD